MNSGDVEPDLPGRLYTHVNRLAGLIGPRHLGKPNSLIVAMLIEVARMPSPLALIPRWLLLDYWSDSLGV